VSQAGVLTLVVPRFFLHTVQGGTRVEDQLGVELSAYQALLTRLSESSAPSNDYLHEPGVGARGTSTT
jgi:hypothetical protein